MCRALDKGNIGVYCSIVDINTSHPLQKKPIAIYFPWQTPLESSIPRRNITACDTGEDGWQTLRKTTHDAVSGLEGKNGRRTISRLREKTERGKKTRRRRAHVVRLRRRRGRERVWPRWRGTSNNTCARVPQTRNGVWQVRTQYRVRQTSGRWGNRKMFKGRIHALTIAKTI